MSFIRKSTVLIFLILLLEVSRSRVQWKLPLPDNFYDKVKTKLTWSVYDVYVTANDRAKIKDAFDFWANYTRFSFEEVSIEGSPANIRIHIYSNYYTKDLLSKEDNKNGFAVARTASSPKEQKAIVFVTSYNDWKHYNQQNEKALNLRSVMKHQLGYILDQQDTAAFSSTMRPSYHITKTSNLTKEEKSKALLGIKVDDEAIVIKESYTMPQDICKPKFDSILYTYVRGDVYFIGEYAYDKWDRTFGLVHDLWPQLPKNLTTIDASCTDTDGVSFFFIGQQVLAIKDSKLLANHSDALTKWLNSVSVDHVDGAFPHETGIYIVIGNQYWKFDRQSNGEYSPTGLSKEIEFLTGSLSNETHIERYYYPHNFYSEDHDTFDWLGLACQPAQKELVCPECCNY